MSEAVAVGHEAKDAVALTTARLEAVLREARADEARLKRILNLRRLERRLRETRADESRRPPRH